MVARAGRKDEILATFIRHVAERGYDQTNLGDIAGELGMSKGTIVHHFGTKAQMLRDLEENYMARRKHDVDLMWQQVQSPAERIAALVYAAVFYQVEDRDATIATQREIVQLADDPEMAKIRQHRRDIQHVMSEELRAGVESGVFRRVDPSITSLQIFGSLQWMWTWFDPKGPHSPEQVGASFVDVFLGGLLVDRLTLAKLADPKGQLPKIVRKCIREAQQAAAA